jgi:hypothetical protein
MPDVPGKNMEIQIKKPIRYYKWLAEYEDGTTIDQDKISFKEILKANEEGKVKFFALIPKNYGIHKKIVVKLGGKRRLIYFERTVGCFSGEVDPILVYLLGWQETVRGVNIKTICYIYPNGNVEINNDEPSLLTDYLTKLRQSNAN